MTNIKKTKLKKGNLALVADKASLPLTDKKKSLKKKEQPVEKAEDVFENYRRKWKAMSPGWYAILTKDNDEFFRLLKTQPDKVIVEQNSVCDILGLALQYRNYKAADKLLEAGILPDFKNALGQTAVHFAARELYTEEQYQTAKNWLTKNNFDLTATYAHNEIVYNFEILARESMKRTPIAWVSDYNPLFEEKPQWVKDKEAQAAEEKNEVSKKVSKLEAKPTVKLAKSRKMK